jgi:hypothetical protein
MVMSRDLSWMSEMSGLPADVQEMLKDIAMKTPLPYETILRRAKNYWLSMEMEPSVDKPLIALVSNPIFDLHGTRLQQMFNEQYSCPVKVMPYESPIRHAAKQEAVKRIKVQNPMTNSERWYRENEG